MRHGLLLFAHGARDARWALPFEAVAQRVRERHPGWDVRLAYLEFMTPDLATAAQAMCEQGATRIDVVPLFLGAGGHVRRDLPQLLTRLRLERPGVVFELHPAVGELPAVIDAMALAAAALAGTAQDHP